MDVASLLPNRDDIQIASSLRGLDDVAIERGIRRGELGLIDRKLVPKIAGGTQANDSILVAPDGSGAAVATHLVNSKEYQVFMEANDDGHLIGTKQDWFAFFTPTTNANAREVAEIFNADATAVVRIRGLWLIPTFTAITGAQIAFDVNRISAVGTTGSTVITPRPADTSHTALDADITARFGSTAGATLSYLYFQQYTFNEETNAGFAIVPWFNLMPTLGDRVVEFVLRQNSGIQIKQSVAMTTGLTGALAYFVVE